MALERLQALPSDGVQSRTTQEVARVTQDHFCFVSNFIVFSSLPRSLIVAFIPVTAPELFVSTSSTEVFSIYVPP
jgi:hypothetical protein